MAHAGIPRRSTAPPARTGPHSVTPSFPKFFIKNSKLPHAAGVFFLYGKLRQNIVRRAVRDMA